MCGHLKTRHNALKPSNTLTAAIALLSFKLDLGGDFFVFLVL